MPPVLDFLAEHLLLSHDEAYGTFTMGAGFVVYVAADAVAVAQTVARARGVELLHAGAVEAGPRRVVIRPLGVTYEAAALQIR